MFNTLTIDFQDLVAPKGDCRPTVGQLSADSRPTGFLGSSSSQLPHVLFTFNNSLYQSSNVCCGRPNIKSIDTFPGKMDLAACIALENQIFICRVHVPAPDYKLLICIIH